MPKRFVPLDVPGFSGGLTVREPSVDLPAVYTPQTTFEGLLLHTKGPLAGQLTKKTAFFEEMIREAERPPWHRRRWNLLKWWWRSNLAWRFARHEPGQDW